MRLKKYLSYILLLSFFVKPYSQTEKIRIEGGYFTIGEKSSKYENETPAKKVYVSSFYIDNMEITNKEYNKCVKAGKCSKPHYDDGKCLMWTNKGIKKVIVPQKYRSDDYPVTCVTWYQAKQFCRYKGGKLPSEAQWEYAASKKGEYAYAWGNSSPTLQKAKFFSSSPAKSGSYPKDKYSLYDMTGNVWEWTSDRYDKEYYEYIDAKDPKGPPVGRYVTIRGGGWYSTKELLNVKRRLWFPPERGEVSLGFRCVK